MEVLEKKCAANEGFLEIQRDRPVVSPFGSCIGKTVMSAELVARLNCELDKAIILETPDMGSHLAGKIKIQPGFLPETGGSILAELSDFILQYYEQAHRINTLGTMKLKGEFQIALTVGWWMEMESGEYNPAHHHPMCHYSCIGFLQIPESMENGWAVDERNTDGCTQFLYGSPGPDSSTGCFVRPKLNDFYIFPSQLLHVVYPFKGEGKRRSFSANLTITQTGG